MRIIDYLPQQILELVGAATALTHHMERYEWIVVLLILLILLLLYRHSLLAYGTKGAEVMASVVLLVLWLFAASFSGIALAWPLLILLPLIGGMELLVTSYALPRTPFLTYDVGLCIGLLGLVHPSAVLLLLLVIHRLRGSEIGTGRHISALLLGTASVLWMALLLVSEPSAAGVWHTLSDYIAPAMHPQLPPRRLWPMAGLCLIVLVALSLQVSVAMGSAISRHRWMVQTHLGMAWVSYLLWVVYGAGIGAGVHFYLYSTLFWMSAALRLIVLRHSLSISRLLAIAIPTLLAIIYGHIPLDL